MSDIPDPPSTSPADVAATVAKAAISLVPVVGGPVVELLDLLQTPYERRQAAWMDAVNDALRRLHEERVTPEQLAENQEWISALAAASRVALGTHLEEKLAMLKSVLIKMALEPVASEVIVRRFIRFVDELQPEHFMVLSYLADPTGWYEAKGLDKPNTYMGPPRGLLDQAQLEVHGEELAVVLADLSDHHLADTSSLGTMMTQQGIWQPWATSLGKQLLDWTLAFD